MSDFYHILFSCYLILFCWIRIRIVFARIGIHIKVCPGSGSVSKWYGSAALKDRVGEGQVVGKNRLWGRTGWGETQGGGRTG